MYGQTGAGKTHSLDSITSAAISQVFATAAADDVCDYGVSVSVLELYNEVLRCLISGREVNLMMGREGLMLEGLAEKVRGGRKGGGGRWGERREGGRGDEEGKEGGGEEGRL